MAGREKRVRQIQQSLRVVEKQIHSTEDEGKLVSLKKRVERYKTEIADFSRQLTDKVSLPTLLAHFSSQESPLTGSLFSLFGLMSDLLAQEIDDLIKETEVEDEEL